MGTRIVMIHPAAPPKPAAGAPCNGCGVCCAAQPCPLGMLLSLRLHGACRLLDWQAGQYRCRALQRAPRGLKRLVRRWIAAGAGCDSDLIALPPAAA
jgi:hypothetical protein